MDATNAGGRNTQLPTSPGVVSLEADLHNVAGAIAALLADARVIDPDRDEFGHARSRAYTDAVALLKVSAKLGHSIAALRGSKFEHNINVRRQDAGHSSASDANEEEEESMIWLNGDTLWDWRKKRTYVLDPTRDAGGWPMPKGSEGTPLPISGGSNGNFGNSEPVTSQSGIPE